MRTVPTPAAREDILAQFRYYALDQGVPDVGFRFLDAVEAAIARIGEMPAIGAPRPAAIVGRTRGQRHGERKAQAEPRPGASTGRCRDVSHVLLATPGDRERAA